MKAWFVSDIHLRDLNERNSILLLRFLRFLKKDSETTHLFLLGDIFDLWVGSSEVFQIKFQSIVDAIWDLKNQGVEVVYFEGNHDVHVHDFWQKKFAIPVMTEAHTVTLGGLRVRMEHGDFINTEDSAYLRYRSVLRSSTLESAAQVIPGFFLDKLGTMASKISRQHSSVKRRDSEEQLRAMIRKYAQDQHSEESFDVLVTGHMHILDDFQFQRSGKSVRSINLGSWFEKPQALCLYGDQWSWVDIQALPS